ncbi:MAG: hypothetical protein V4568_13740 [Pseudomonadota bacterium]
MILDSQLASQFIEGYKKLLLEIEDPSEKTNHQQLLQKLVAGRSKLVDAPSLIEKALTSLASKSETIDEEVIRAVRNLKVRDWVYLRDTKSYSILIEPSDRTAFGAVGLTNRIRDVIGGSGAFMEIGLVCFHGRFVMDGLISRVVWLGKNYMSDFRDLFAEIKSEGQFHKKCGA